MEDIIGLGFPLNAVKAPPPQAHSRAIGSARSSSLPFTPRASSPGSSAFTPTKPATSDFEVHSNSSTPRNKGFPSSMKTGGSNLLFSPTPMPTPSSFFTELLSFLPPHLHLPDQSSHQVLLSNQTTPRSSGTPRCSGTFLHPMDPPPTRHEASVRLEAPSKDAAAARPSGEKRSVDQMLQSYLASLQAAPDDLACDADVAANEEMQLQFDTEDDQEDKEDGDGPNRSRAVRRRIV